MFVAILSSSWNEAKAILGNRGLWAFRGHGDATWLPETSLFRTAARKAVSPESLINREEWVLYQFKRFAHHFRKDLPEPADPLDWLALIQHYGGPTRLLDFTKSFYVAAFFALESADNDAAVWAVNTQSLDDAVGELLGVDFSGGISEIRAKRNDWFNAVFGKSGVPPAVIAVEPERMHERSWTQQGIFLAPTDPSMPFTANLAAAFGCHEGTFAQTAPVSWVDSMYERSWEEPWKPNSISVIKLILPVAVQEDALIDLKEMNISAATLFPGLDGFARSLHEHV